MLFAHAYAHLPYDDLLKPKLVPLWGSNGKMMSLATKEVQSLSASDEKLAEAARGARAAALAAAAELVTATQSQEKFFKAVISAPGDDECASYALCESL